MDTDKPTSQFENCPVEDSVGYLLARARTMLSKAVDDSLRELDITHTQGSIFLMLEMGKCSTAAELARDLFIDAAAMKRTLDKLEAKGLLQRVANAKDKRLFQLELTAAGQALTQQLPTIYSEVLAVGFTGFSPEEVGFLKCLLRKLLANRPLLEVKHNDCQGN